MARNQKDYLADLLADDEAPVPAPAADEASGPIAPPARPDRMRGTTLLSRESALARVATGEVRQVTQMLLDPARVRVWTGNARHYNHLTEENCRELIDSILAEGGQKVPAVVRRIDNDPDHDFEVIAGTRRHWSISWLRRNSYPEMQFVAQVVALDDEAAFRLADLENRARKDVSDLERARNYTAALRQHYGNHMTRMADRLKVSKGWLSKMLKVAALPDVVVSAFASPDDIQLKPAYALAQLFDDKARAATITSAAKQIAKLQAERRMSGDLPFPAAEVLRRLHLATESKADVAEPFTYKSKIGRDALSLVSSNRQGATIRLHAGSGATEDELLRGLREALAHLDASGRGLLR
ncbi:ParB/RepB/Spo0J family partition protein [Sphingobium sp. RAC03]|uniref:ParB/RepB/Spo0J family partition protein n=1 Tax=Sphingobium sp. RAC03 TaxID=1843368 RepID=UPI00083E56A4|nr:ParB/RepB/Spo0J family partition protein [Sphingobium sp. RAC03]AOF98583.1 ParB/RepB/Spo0J family partition domain protein [Sphingobium sp. RAC03]